MRSLPEIVNLFPGVALVILGASPDVVDKPLLLETMIALRYE